MAGGALTLVVVVAVAVAGIISSLAGWWGPGGRLPWLGLEVVALLQVTLPEKYCRTRARGLAWGLLYQVSSRRVALSRRTLPHFLGLGPDLDTSVRQLVQYTCFLQEKSFTSPSSKMKSCTAQILSFVLKLPHYSTVRVGSVEERSAENFPDAPVFVSTLSTHVVPIRVPWYCSVLQQYRSSY